MSISRGNPFSGLWGSFQTAVNDPEIRRTPGGVQMYVWQSIRNDYLARREPLPQGAFGHVNQLLSLAGQQRRAASELQSAFDRFKSSGMDQAIEHGIHTAPDVDARFPQHQISGPEMRVRFDYQVLVEGEPVYLRGTWDPGVGGLQSLSELEQGLEEAAEALSEGYDYEYAPGSALISGITTV